MVIPASIKSGSLSAGKSLSKHNIDVRSFRDGPSTNTSPNTPGLIFGFANQKQKDDTEAWDTGNNGSCDGKTGVLQSEVISPESPEQDLAESPTLPIPAICSSTFDTERTNVYKTR